MNLRVFFSTITLTLMSVSGPKGTFVAIIAGPGRQRLVGSLGRAGNRLPRLRPEAHGESTATMERRIERPGVESCDGAQPTMERSWSWSRSLGGRRQRGSMMAAGEVGGTRRARERGEARLGGFEWNAAAPLPNSHSGWPRLRTLQTQSVQWPLLARNTGRERACEVATRAQRHRIAIALPAYRDPSQRPRQKTSSLEAQRAAFLRGYRSNHHHGLGGGHESRPPAR